MVPEGLATLAIPARSYATARVEGTSKAIDETYLKLARWVGEHGLRPDPEAYGLERYGEHRQKVTPPYERFDYDLVQSDGSGWPELLQPLRLEGGRARGPGRSLRGQLGGPIHRAHALLRGAALSGCDQCTEWNRIELGGPAVLFLGLAASVGIAGHQLSLLSRHGQTIGKRMMRIRVVRTDGSPASLGRILVLRNLVPFFINFFCGFFSLVDALFIFQDDRRCLHDMMADTKVVKAGEET